MKIAIIGAGAIGSTIAAYLTKKGTDVLLVGREDQVKTILENGLMIKGVGGDENFNVRAATELDQAYDLVIFATKTQDLERAYQQNAEYLEGCYVLTTQNGVQADNILSHHYDKDKQFSSIVMFGATFTKPGEIIYNFPGDWIIGRPFVHMDPKFHEVVEVLTTEELPIVPSSDITGMKHLKLFVNFNNCIPALIGKSMQETFADMDLCRLSIQLLKEGVKIVEDSGINLESLPNFPADRIYGMMSMPEEQAAGIIHKTLTGLSKEPLYGSILQSIMRNKPSEIDFINGEVVALANARLQKAPLNAKVVDMVHTVEQSGKYFDIKEIKQEFELNVGEKI